MSMGMPPMEPPAPPQGAMPPPGPAPFATTQGLPPIDEMQRDANLVPHFTEKELTNIADTCCRDYDADVESRRPRMKRLAEYQGIYASVMKAKNFPWTDAANVNLPVLTYPWLQVQGRLFDMLWPANGKIFYSAPTGSDDVSRANITETFGNAYIRHRMPEMSQGLDDTLHQCVGYGSAFRRTYWNEYEERAASDWIPIADFVVMDTQRSQDPSMRDVPRYTLVQRLNRFDLEAWGDRGIYFNIEKIQWGDPDKPKETEFEAKLKVIDGTMGSEDDSSTDDKPRMVIEQHRTWRLPDQVGKHADMDGKPHAVIITIDYQSKQVLRVMVREENDPTDHKRYQRQKQEFDGFSQALAAFEAATMAPPQIMVGPDGSLIQAPSPMPPPMPKWMKTDDDGNHLPPKAQRKREICFFTHYRAFPSEGFYGLGLGDFLIGLVKAINTLCNQHIDGLTLRNAKGGFISKTMKGQRGNIAISPGKFIEIDAPTGALKDGIAWLEPPQNDPTTMPMISMLMTAADKLVASSDLMSGQTSGANRTAKETQILAEQMMMQITVLARRMKEAQRHEIDKLWRIWGVFLPEEELVSVIGEDGDPRELKIGRAMFVPDANVIPAADPRTKTQRIEDAMTVYAAVTSNPYLMNSPNRDVLMRAVTEDVLRAHGAEKLLKMLPSPPQPPPPPQPKQYFEEDADFLQNKPSPVLPGDDDERHSQGHAEFANTPAGQSMSKEMKLAHEQHRRDHEAQKIRKAAQQQPQLASGPPLPDPNDPRNGGQQ